MKSIELFAGAGGLALGVSQAGFRHLAVIEKDKYCCDTIRENQRLGLDPISKWPLFEQDAQTFDYSQYCDQIDLVTGGPPCQPFSIGGKHLGPVDSRNLFPESVRAVREIRPKAFVFENVRGLTRPHFQDYLQYICLSLSFPENSKKSGELWMEHFKRLKTYEKKGLKNGLSYSTATKVLNSSEFGIPQKRQRIFIIGFRNDQNSNWNFPEPTHSEELLLISQYITGEYWDRHEITCPKTLNGKLIGSRLRKIGARLNQGEFFRKKPSVTVRDAISDLPLPYENKDIKNPSIENHTLQPGARCYPGHTGSQLDQPAKALKAGDHGVPGGENMLACTDGSVRYFTIRETARLQTFPDAFIFHGTWTETMRQLGNAVPVKLAALIASAVAQKLENKSGASKR